MRELVGMMSVPRSAAESTQRAAIEESAKVVERAFREAGLEPMSDPFLAGKAVTRNIEVELKGNTPEVFVIGARYDVDLGGLASIVELATRVSRGGVVPHYTLRIVAFGGKLGPEIYAQRCAARGETLAGSLLLDGVGGTKPLRIVGNLKSRSIAKEAAKKLEGVGDVERSTLPAFFPGGRRSAFTHAGWPMVRVTDGIGKKDELDLARLERLAAALVDFVR